MNAETSLKPMKMDLFPTPKDLSLSQVMKRFSCEVDAREYLEAIRWPNGVVCPHCKNSDQKKIWKIHANVAKKVRPGLYRCAECDKEFTVTVGTIFEDSHIPLSKWLVAFYMMATAKKGISALWIQQNLGLGSYRTAWMMMHKIRHALKDPAFMEPLSGTLECDETFVNALPRQRANEERPVKGYRQGSEKVPVVALVEREGGIRAKVVPNVSQKNLRLFIGLKADVKSTVNTDEFAVYRPILRAFKRHDRVNHKQKEYARHNPDGTVSHVNSCESFFSLLKRGVYGSFHHVSKEHLPRYCDEFSFRWNHRDLNSGQRFVAGLQRAEGKRLTYRKPIAK
jgi:transposase-like protein